MPQRAGRRCAFPGCREPGPRCDRHRSQQDRGLRRTTPTKVVRTRAEQQRRADAVTAHRAELGDWCPGYGRPGHAATDLTADDVIPVSATGRPSEHLEVLCRSCNSRKGGVRRHQ